MCIIESSTTTHCSIYSWKLLSTFSYKGVAFCLFVSILFKNQTYSCIKYWISSNVSNFSGQSQKSNSIVLPLSLNNWVKVFANIFFLSFGISANNFASSHKYSSKFNLKLASSKASSSTFCFFGHKTTHKDSSSCFARVVASSVATFALTSFCANKIGDCFWFSANAEVGSVRVNNVAAAQATIPGVFDIYNY